MNILNTSIYTIDAKYSLNNEYKDNSSNSIIILNGYNIKQTINDLKEKYDKVIIYNFESYDNKFKFLGNSNYINLIKNADEVWDYDEENIKHLSYLRNDIQLHILKPFIDIPQNEKEYDVLFYGTINKRRNLILNELIKSKIKVKIIYNLFGNSLNDYISKSKCLLNVHFYDSKLQEQVRMIRWINNGKIFSEKSIRNYLNIDEYDYNELVPKIKEYLNNYETTNRL